MATKWRSKGIFIVWTLLVTIGLNGLAPLKIWLTQYIHTNYYDSTKFEDKRMYFTELLSDYQLYQVPIEEAKKNISVTKEEIAEYRDSYSSLNEQMQLINEQYEEDIALAIENGDEAAEKLLTEERDRDIKEITELLPNDEYVQEKIKEEKQLEVDRYYRDLENTKYEFEQWAESFYYYLENGKTGKVVTNMTISPGDTIEKVVNKDNTNFLGNFYFTSNTEKLNLPGQSIIYRDKGFAIWSWEDEMRIPTIVNQLKKEIGNYEGIVAVPKKLSNGSLLIEEENKYYAYQKKMIFGSSLSIISLVVCIFMLVKRKISFAQWYYSFYRKVPIDIRYVLLVISAILAVIGLWGVGDQLSMEVNELGGNWGDILAFLLLAWVFVTLSLIQGYLLFKEKVKWKNTFISISVNKMKTAISQLLSSRDFTKKAIGSLLVIFMLGLFLPISLIFPIFLPFYLVVALIIGIPVIIFVVRNITAFSKLLAQTNAVINGDLHQEISIQGAKELTSLAKNINTLKSGVIVSKTAQEKSERLKTELITNVSHDLRTPLTSIINYTELLKNKNLTDEEKEGYLGIIDRKSQRLKVLIDDLFEVSKMVSGNVEMKKEKIDLVQLLQQALGEYDENIKDSSLDFRVTNQEPSIFAVVDGQKLWRVFDNLIGNILKYSLEHSRVYLSIKQEKGQAILQFKNISKYELDDNMDELFERFKRGDTSRHTEGSGLGLAIAKSIIDLHEGMMTIETDGDLFKVTLVLPVNEQRS
ncbi:GHKL domain-containing protein [Cytobacillus oceanisediminis]|uniref:sensor histidine kinase n=1 Tax=Cytobacillus oceanisediminis TaxID=665099 RepID=UPI001CCE480C|nr:HAMP domain-containing sensor histidine kinase [Cytobacillus oceanisediminis]MBZ9536726.1 GHKL domain-containing protein [Cytobacillus oceanisediminis]